MRIALVSEHYLPHVGGIERHVADLGERLAGLGHEVHVITTTPGPSEMAGIAIHRLRVPLVPVVRIPFTPFGILRLEDLFRKHAFDLVHCHHSVVSPAVACAAYYAQRMGIPTVVTFHSILVGYIPAFRFLDRISAWSRWPVVFSAVSSGLAEGLHEIMPDREVAILPNGVDPEFWQSPRRSNHDGVVRIISTLRLAPRKRPLALVRIAARLRASLPPGAHFRLLIIGEGPERTKMRKSIEALGLGALVELRGELPLESIREAYAGAHIFILASVEESFGLAALEASSARLPVVARRSPGLAQFLQEGENGFLADSDEEMVIRLVQLITDPPLRERMSFSDCGPPSTMTWPHVLETHLDAYTKATDLAGTPRL
jgi:glycosyltransferase involved in cell wall biosynthesis